MHQPDVVVVGAGPAGTAAAIQLARAGHRVTVVEAAEFPRRKVCGGCLSGDAVALAGGLLGGAVTGLGTCVSRITFGIRRRAFHTAGGDRCRIVPRDVLDSTLAEAAARAGAKVQFGTGAQLLRESEERFSICAGGQRLRPRWIVWAGGLAAGGMLSRAGCPQHACRRAMIGQAWSVVPTDACPPVGEVSMRWLRGGYVGLATVSAGECLVALAVEKDLAGCGGPRQALCAMNGGESSLGVLNLPATIAKLGTAGFPHRPRCVGWGNMLLAGDAAGFEEPFSGEGIGQALRSGLAAADAVLSSGTDEEVLGGYRRRLRHHRGVRRRTRWLSGALRSSAVFALADCSIPGVEAIGSRLLRGVHVKPSIERV